MLKKDGKVYTYASKYYLQSQITTPIEWHLTRVEDPFGNYIQYEYTNESDSGAFYPKKILYTGHQDSSPMYEIVFEYGYDQRNDCPPKWFSKTSANQTQTGFSRINKKIESIQCRYNGQRIIQYTLNYNTLDWNIRALSSINKSTFDYNRQRWADNELIATEFDWKQVNYKLQNDSVSCNLGIIYNDYGLWYQHSAFAARFEHDSPVNLPKNTHDIVHLMQKQGGGSGRYYLNIFYSEDGVYSGTHHYRYNESMMYDCSSVNVNFTDGRKIIAFMPADTDGDGLNEIVCVSYYRSNNAIDVTLIQKTPNSSVFVESVSKLHLYGNPSIITDFTIGDFNGDGLSDLFFLYEGSPHVRISASESPFSIISQINNYHFSNRRKIVIADFSGNKKDQIIILDKDQNNNPYSHYFHLYQKNNGQYCLSGRRDILADITENCLNSDNTRRRLCSGDFNGDGKSDLAILQQSNWRFYFSQGNGLFLDALLNYQYIDELDAMTPESDTINPANAIVTDLDNDGCDDIAIIKTKTIELNSFDRYKKVFRKDFLIRPTAQSIKIKKVGKLRWDNQSQDSVDICLDSIYMNGDYYAAFRTFLPIVGNHKGTAPNEIIICRMGAKISLNSRLGLFMHNTGCLNAPPVRAIKRIINSLGATTEIDYKPISYQQTPEQLLGRNLEGKESGSRDMSPTLPFYGYMNVVAKVLAEMNDDGATASNSPKTYRMTRYYYVRPHYHTRGRGFLGFERIWNIKQGQVEQDDIIKILFHGLNETYSVLIPDSLKRYKRSDLEIPFQRTSFTYSFHNHNNFDPDLGVIPNDVFATHLSNTITCRTDGTPVLFEKEVFHKDSLGNIDVYEHRYGSSKDSFPYYEKTVSTFDNRLTANRWIIGLPKSEILTQHLTSNTITRRVSYQNNTNLGQRTEQCTEPGNEKQLHTTYLYDDYGNLVTTTSTGSGITRTESNEYSLDGRFLIAKTNAMGHTTHYYYNEATGRTDSITDPNGLTTQFKYDILGNLKQTVYPSGIKEDNCMMWVGVSGMNGYHPDTPDFGAPVYFTYAKRSGERESFVFYDQHNRKLREVSCNMAGEKIYVDYKYYNISGILWQVSKPYFHDMNETPMFSTYNYDWLGRNTRINRADGGFMNKDYVGTTETTIDFDGQKTTLLYTKAGLVEFALSYNSPDNAVASQFSYYGDGKVKTANSITYCYDVNGNPLSVSDPSLGLLTYDYNAFGELVESTTPNDETCYTYDALGRMTQRSGSDGNSYWTYDSGFIGALASTTYIPTNGPIIKEGFLYDQYGHLIQQTQRVGEEEEWTFNYTYNRLGKQSSITYPSGKKVKYHYNSKGFMDYVKDASTDDVLWQANASDRWDNISSFTEGDIDVEYSYDPVTGLVNSIGATRNSQILLNQAYHWTTTGNLDWRTDTTLGLKERFGYDFSNRLTSAITRNLAETQTYSDQDFVYDFRGNITQKTGVGSYAYDATPNRYAVTGLQPEAGQEALFPHQEATYTSFDKLSTLSQDGKTLSVNYGIDRQRMMQTFSDGTTTRTKRYFTPLYETVAENGVTKKLHYFTAETGLFAIFATQSNGGSTMHYTLKDHQGNLTATISGNTVERLSYDAWGRRRNPVGFGYSNVTHTFDRGYTLHEHYDDFDLINMNGRLYDPVLGRMLSPDIAIQDEHNSQAYNRYSYCFNNPLRFTDPSGYVVDEWEIDAYGQIINHKKDKTQDVFYLVEKDEKGNYVRVKDENGNYKSIAFEYGTIEKQKTISLASGTYDTYEARGDENGKSLFEFFAEIVRDQGIEVSYAKTGKEGDKGLNFITTSHVTPMSHYDENGVLHKTASEPGMTHLLENKLLYGYTIRELNHSHPLSSKVSSADENLAKQVKDIQKKNGYHIPKFYIYVVSSKEYIPFGF